ncbi:Gfo/Idh/MocA family protein [Halalkalibacter alkaliphilus]|uniref:Gfo/Idh/MocA family oxidoreductase n=1 Tax=Halalkalibacter alkaliphilus TaxID=2917993 RepID=A0A9X2IAV1_9BACI|nr:Gfo/Idh/MocA family oxidoreductase [Halalkalibacter alkaliphilus]MCL7749725.1 Gfo/Idh/MocA family oxidoreductase [Halalkalibacter alkaliphilus]
MLKVAVIGLGDISSIHIQAIQANSNVELVAVCDIDESLKNKVPSANFYRNYHELLEKEPVDCVHNCLPHYLHYPVTKACMEMGIHVFQEKPLGLSAAEGEKLVRLEESNKSVKLCVCLQNRYNESFEMLQQMVMDGQYGQLIGLKGIVPWYRPKSYYDSKPWRGKIEYAGGGVMINQALHTLDLMQLIGGEIEEIRGSISHLLDYGIEVEDTATANIMFKNGATGLFYATNAHSENASVEIEAIFEKGRFTIKDSKLLMTREDGMIEKLVEDTKMPGTKFYYGASHSKLISQFYSCVLNNSQDYVHARDALTSMTMIDAIQRSSEENRKIKLEV